MPCVGVLGNELRLIDPRLPDAPLLQVKDVTAFALTPPVMMTAHGDRAVRRWELRDGVWFVAAHFPLLAIVRGPYEEPRALALSPSGAHVLVECLLPPKPDRGRENIKLLLDARTGEYKGDFY